MTIEESQIFTIRGDKPYEPLNLLGSMAVTISRIVSLEKVTEESSFS